MLLNNRRYIPAPKIMGKTYLGLIRNEEAQGRRVMTKYSISSQLPYWCILSETQIALLLTITNSNAIIGHMKSYIKKYRIDNDLTQKGFGRLFAPVVTQGAVGQWELWENNPEHKNATKISLERALDIERVTNNAIPASLYYPKELGSRAA